MDSVLLNIESSLIASSDASFVAVLAANNAFYIHNLVSYLIVVHVYISIAIVTLIFGSRGDFDRRCRR